MKPLMLLMLVFFIGCNESKNIISRNEVYSEAKNLTSIKSLVNIGMCAGLCVYTIQIEKTKVIFTQTNNEYAGVVREKSSEKRLEGEITDNEWEEILQLVNKTEFTLLPENIKRPNESDCGKMLLEVNFDGGSINRIAYECYPPPELRKLETKLSEIRERFRKKSNQESN
ncbi:MAG TPA: hypothetical protein VNI60_12375 [Pyrinomonadaceae bacterium]|nr:hypothetical protein [Pyrinomonadaceae bacterium]